MVYFRSYLLVALLTATSLAKSRHQTLRVAHQERGILTLNFDASKPPEQSLQLLSTTQAGYQPGWLHTRGDKLYSISRGHFPDNSSSSAGIFVFDKYPNGQLKLVDTANSNGEGGVYVDISPDGKILSSANIDGSTVSIFPVNPNGNLGDKTYTFHYNLTQPGPGANDSQIIANPHEAVFNPSGEFFVVPDRGADRVYVYEVHGPNQVEQIKNITLLPGTGPRHLVFSGQSRNTSLMFLVSELDNTINVFSFDKKATPCKRESSSKGILEVTHLQSISALFGNDSRTDPVGGNLASEISLSHDDRYLYVSLRNTESLDKLDSLGIFSVDSQSRKEPLKYLGSSSTNGKIPRHFSLSPDKENQFVAVTNQVTNDLFIMKRDAKTGFLGQVVGNFSFGELDLSTKIGPMCVIWG